MLPVYEGLSLAGGNFLPVCGRNCTSFATHLSGPVPARNADPDWLKSNSNNKSKSS
jgi:hypothetical protein